MTTRSQPISDQRPQFRVQAHIGVPSMRTIILGLVALLILFRWLHLILALQTATAGREIQLKNEEYGRHQRQNSVLQNRIAEAQSPRILAQKALQLGLVPHMPRYLPVEEEAEDPNSDAEVLCPQPHSETCLPGRAGTPGEMPAKAMVSGLLSAAGGAATGNGAEGLETGNVQ